MKIVVKEKTQNLSKEHWFEKILITLENIKCHEYLVQLVNLSQSQQRLRIIDLQNFITETLIENHEEFEWTTEFKVSDKKDSIDIYGKQNNEIVIIELDKWRADQVAKKLISRTALLIDEKIGFISICYGGTKKMNQNECLKYFHYGNIIQTKMKNYYAGLIIE